MKINAEKLFLPSIYNSQTFAVGLWLKLWIYLLFVSISVPRFSVTNGFSFLRI